MPGLEKKYVIRLVIRLIIAVVLMVALAVLYFQYGLYLVYGLTTPPLPAQDTLLSKVSSDGTPEWQAAFPGTIGPVGIAEDPDGGYLLYGGGALPGKSVPYWRVIKTGKNGSVVWDVTKLSNAYFPEILNFDIPMALLPVDGGYTVVEHGGTVIRLDRDGKDVWHRQYYSNTFEAAPAPEGGTVLAGVYHYRESSLARHSTDIGWVLMTDDRGDRVWEHQFHEYQYCNELNVSAGGTVQVRCSGPPYGSNITGELNDLVILNSQGNITTREPLGHGVYTPDGRESYPIVQFYATALPGGKIHIHDLWHSNASVHEMIISDSTGRANLTGTYAMVPTGDRGFLVFSTAMT